MTIAQLSGGHHTVDLQPSRPDDAAEDDLLYEDGTEEVPV
jgi:hypothetical protein